MPRRQPLGFLSFCGYNVPYHPVWQPLVSSPEFKAALATAARLIMPDVQAGLCTPQVPDILRFLQFALVSAVIMGQDPYKQASYATGFAFEVNGLTSWTDLADKCPGSNAAALKTLVRLFFMTATDWSQKRKRRPAFRKAAKAADNREIHLLPPQELFIHWQKVGILPLNASLSTKVDQSNAHRVAWTQVRSLLIQYIAKTWPDAVWFLWGTAAKELAKLLPSGTVIHRAGHPDLQGTPEDSDQFFYKASGIPETWGRLKWTGPDQGTRHGVSIKRRQRLSAPTPGRTLTGEGVKLSPGRGSKNSSDATQNDLRREGGERKAR